MKKLLVLFLSLFFATIPSVFASQPKKSKRTNFIIIIADDVNWNDIGCYSHPHIRTPHLDKMAKQGLRFDASFLTTSSCSPSRCSIMTGRYPHNTGAAELHQPLPGSQVVFAGLLRRAGYHTASGGKWHLGKAAEKNFDVVVVGGRPSGCEKWVELLRKRPKDRPFFMWFAAIDAHRPYAKKAIARPHTAKDAVVPPFLPDNPATRRDLALYYDEVSRLDDYVGQVLAELERQGIAGNTVVIFMADNGRPFPRCKTTLYDSGIQTPFIVRWPERIKGRGVCGNLVSAVDIAPTVLELAGVKAGPTFQGRSFAKMLTSPEKAIREFIFAEHNWHDFQAHERAVRSQRYLYIRNAFPKLAGTPPADAVRSPTFQTMLAWKRMGKLSKNQMGCFLTPRPREELYDVRKDPYSLKNLATNAKYGRQLTAMRKELNAWIQRTQDAIPDNPTPDRFHRVNGTRLKNGK